MQTGSRNLESVASTQCLAYSQPSLGTLLGLLALYCCKDRHFGRQAAQMYAEMYASMPARFYMWVTWLQLLQLPTMTIYIVFVTRYYRCLKSMNRFGIYGLQNSSCPCIGLLVYLQQLTIVASDSLISKLNVLSRINT